MRSASIDSLRLPAARSIGLVAVLAILTLAGCGKDKTTNPNPGGGSTTYTGSVTGSTTSGKLTLTVATASPAQQERSSRAQAIVTATGTFTPSGGGTAVNLSGQYDNVGKSVIVSGTGWTFSGDLTSFGMEGNFTGPGGATGVFSLEEGTTGVTVVIGRFTSVTPPGETGNFNVSISGTGVHGNAVPDAGGTPIPLDGTYTASNGAISIVNPAAPAGPPLAIGTYNGGTGNASGTYDDQAGNSGDWSGAKQP